MLLTRQEVDSFFYVYIFPLFGFLTNTQNIFYLYWHIWISKSVFFLFTASTSLASRLVPAADVTPSHPSGHNLRSSRQRGVPLATVQIKEEPVAEEKPTIVEIKVESPEVVEKSPGKPDSGRLCVYSVFSFSVSFKSQGVKTVRYFKYGFTFEWNKKKKEFICHIFNNLCSPRTDLCRKLAEIVKEVCNIVGTGRQPEPKLCLWLSPDKWAALPK